MTLNPTDHIIDAWAQPASKRSFELLPEIVPHLSFERCTGKRANLAYLILSQRSFSLRTLAGCSSESKEQV